MKNNLAPRPTTQPISAKVVQQVLVVLLICAAFVAGYYADQSAAQKRRIQKLQQQLVECSSLSARNTSKTTSTE